MASCLVLSDCELQVWREDPFETYIEIAYLEICYDPDSDQVIAKQFPELGSQKSYIAYNLDACTYLASREELPNSHIIYLQLQEDIIPAIFVDRDISPEFTADEVKTLEMCCTMSCTRPLAGWKIDITIPYDIENKNLILQLVQILQSRSTTVKTHTDSAKQTPIPEKVEPEMESITLSNEDLDHLEAMIRPASKIVTRHTNNRFRSDRTLDSGHQGHRQQQQNPHERHTPGKESKSVTDAEKEKTLKETWTKNQTMWDDLTGTKATWDTTRGSPNNYGSGREGTQELKSEWVSFAASQLRMVLRTYRSVRVLVTQTA